jgi:hypothetical protein
MNYITLKSDRMQKHKFGVTYLGALLMETALGPEEHEKYCVAVSRPGLTEMHYVTQNLY